uniref:Uncharacterized protein n=1 Tax=Caenorhabditis japonica TaxID=281687 RepID=A0A8R1DH32_CAEJA
MMKKYSSQLRTPRGTPFNVSSVSGAELPYTPPPILAPMRNGSGLFCQIAKLNSSIVEKLVFQKSTDAPSCSGASPNGTNDMKIDVRNGGKKCSEDGDRPFRKNGFFYQQNETKFANELEALRKESWASTSSADEKMQIERKESIEALRKASCMSDSYYDYEGPKISDPNPHINIGKQYQAKVKKWCDREIQSNELESIDDRDEIVFSSGVLQDIDPEQITAFELLACSQACPRAGRNKELALHLLMENKGNIESAVEDLLRSDTLDWEQYSSVFGYKYNDSVYWTPDEIALFQDAIYKTEKEFNLVAMELPGKTVQECVQFYYTWKKACPDDYRKLRNLRRKRHLLNVEINAKNKSVEEKPVVPAKKMSLVESGESDNESNATDASFNGNGHAEFRERAFTSPVVSSPRDEALIGLSPASKDMFAIHKSHTSAPRAHHPASASKKGAQPSADGFFHCRLCDKCFEKVKSLNAHMKSHAMKARAEQEAKAHDAQIAAAAAQLTSAVSSSVTTSPLNPFTNGHLGITIPSTIGSLTPQQLTPQQLNLNQQLQSLSNLSSQLNSQLNSPLTPQQQLQQFTQQQQQLVARAMQQNLFQPATSSSLVQANPLIQAGLHSIH